MRASFRLMSSAARKMPGVRLVATGEELARICKPWVGTLDHFKGMKSAPQWPLPIDKVVWSGQAVVAIVADTRAMAEDAAEAIHVEYDELPAVVDIDTRARSRHACHHTGAWRQRLLPQHTRYRRRRRCLCRRRACRSKRSSVSAGTPP